MRSIKELIKKNCKVYVCIKDDDTGIEFLQQAEKEGFLFSDGAKPTSREYGRIMAVNEDMTINYVGVVGHMAFGSGCKEVGGKELVRVYL